MNPERLLALATARGVNLEAISRGGEPDWTSEDVALAAAGLSRFKFHVALYSLAGDDSVRGSLKWALVERLLEERERQQWATWATNINGARIKFAEDLVALFLLEERSPAKFQAAPHLRAICLGVEGEEWLRKISHQYAYVHGEFHRALVDAEDWVRRKMRQGHDY